MKCARCNLCCKLFPIPETDKKEGEWCKHCTIGKGCNIHGEAMPQRCKNFFCWYSRNHDVLESLRPDNCHIIFEYIESADLYLATYDVHYPNSVKRLDVQRQISRFVRYGKPVVATCFGNDKRLVYATLNRNAHEVWKAVVKASEGLRDGST